MTMNRAVIGLAFIALLGGVARMVMTPLSLIWGTDSTPELVAGLTACVLMALGTTGLLLAQLPGAGVPGFLGAALISFANTLTSCLVWMTMLHAPEEGTVILPLLNMGLHLVGHLLLGGVTLRLGILPRWAAVLLMVWPFLAYVPPLIDWLALVWGLAYVGLALPILRSERWRASGA
jgi:hypothetical protein